MRCVLSCFMLIGLFHGLSWAVAAEKPVVLLDNDGMLLVAGQRTFIFGSYHNPRTPEGLARLRDAGFNLVHSDSARTSLDLIEKHRLLAWIPLGGLFAPATPDQEAKLVAAMRAVADHPALVAWEIPDEALWNAWYGRQEQLEKEHASLRELLRERQKAGTPCEEARKLLDEEAAARRRADYLSAEEIERKARRLLGAPEQKQDLQLSRAPEAAKRLHQRLLRGYRLVHEADGRPVWMNYAPRNTMDDLRLFAEAADIVGCDIYPVPVNPSNGHSDLVNRRMSSVGDYTDRFLQAGAGRPTWMVLQGFGWRDLSKGPKPPAPETGRRPTRHETRFILLDAMVHGARGVLYWGVNYAQDPPTFINELEGVVREAAAQSALWSARDAAVQPKVSFAPTMGSVDRPPRALLKQDGSRRGLLLVNEHTSGLAVHVAGLGVADGSQATILGDADGCALQTGRVEKGGLVVFMPAESALVVSLPGP